jgi:diguanylate cyclase (GGDEF)-like protein
MERSGAAEIAARRAALLFLVAGLLALVHLLKVPGPERAPAAVLGLADIALAGGLGWLPWRRWPPWTTLAVVPVALAMVWSFAGAEVFPPGTYPLFFMVVYVWLGLSHPPWTSLLLAPVLAAGYVAPLLRDTSGLVTAGSVTLAIPVGTLVGEIIARTVRDLELARGESERRSQLLGGVARAARTMNTLDPDLVLTAVVDAALAAPLGFDAAGFLLPEADTSRVSVAHPRGLPPAEQVGGDPAVADLVRRVEELGQTLILRHQPGQPPPVGVLANAGLQVASPVRVDGRVVAVLVAAGHADRGVDELDREALELLAAQAGSALANARRFTDQRALAQELAEISRRDPLTGLGNRRHAANLLAGLQPGDGVLLFDLDQFKQVNDSDGHAAGDAVLCQFGRYLTRELRGQDTTARYGGEEFLVVLHQAGEASVDVAERLNQGWRATNPRTTVSIGVAVHRRGEDPSATLARADAALYQAKRTGRDRVRANLAPA